MRGEKGREGCKKGREREKTIKKRKRKGQREGCKRERGEGERKGIKEKKGGRERGCKRGRREAFINQEPFPRRLSLYVFHGRKLDQKLDV